MVVAYVGGVRVVGRTVVIYRRMGPLQEIDPDRGLYPPHARLIFPFEHNQDGVPESPQSK